MACNEGSREAEEDVNLLAPRLASPRRCLHEEASDSDMSRLEWLIVVRDRTTRIQEIRRELARAQGYPGCTPNL